MSKPEMFDNLGALGALAASRTTWKDYFKDQSIQEIGKTDRIENYTEDKKIDLATITYRNIEISKLLKT